MGNDLLPIPKVTETKDGTIWTSTGTSLYRYNRINEHFTPVVPPGNNPEMNLTVIEDSIGNIWLLNKSKLYKYDNESNKLINWITLPLSDQALTAGAIAFNKSASSIFIENGNTLYEIAPLKRKIVKEVKMPPMVANIWMDGSTVLWISFWTQYLCRYNILSGKRDWFTLPFKNSFSVATCFARDKTKKLWLGSVGGGLWYFDELTNKPVQVNTDNIRPESFHFNENVYSILIDTEGSIWVSTDKGINVFNPSAQKFLYLK